MYIYALKSILGIRTVCVNQNETVFVTKVSEFRKGGSETSSTVSLQRFKTLHSSVNNAVLLETGRLNLDKGRTKSGFDVPLIVLSNASTHVVLVVVAGVVVLERGVKVV